MFKTIYVSYMTSDGMYLFDKVSMPDNTGMTISEYCQSLPNFKSSLRIYSNEQQMNEAMNQLIN